MEPNANGLFTVDQVAVLASKRGCSIHKAGDYGIEIKYPGKLKGQWTHAKIIATDRGLWSPVNIFRACREAAGQPHYEVNQATANIKNPGNLNEVLIAEIIGADGVRPYLSRPSRYHINETVDHIRRPQDGAVKAMLGNGYELDDEFGLSKAGCGDWTWPLLCIFCTPLPWHTGTAGKSYDYRRAVRTLDDAGLLKLPNRRHILWTDTFEWLPLAYLTTTSRPMPKLDPVDDEALTDLMALS
jgi:hypothetical protein